MLPKKNIGAITVMSAFLGLAASRLFTALLYYSYREPGSNTEKMMSLFNGIGVIELLLLIALAVGFGLIFLYSDDLYSTGLLSASALLAVLTVSAKFAVVNTAAPVIAGVSLAMNLCLLGIFALYALYFYRKDLKKMAIIAGSAGLWLAVLSIVIRSFAANASSGVSFVIYALVSLISAVCYGIAYFSQRQSFE